MILEDLLREPLRYPDRQEVDALVEEAMGHLPSTRADLGPRVSHSIRTPLAAILGFREVLDLDPSIPEADRKTYREVIQAETWRLQRFLESLRIIQASRTGDLLFDRSACDLSAIMSEAVTRCALEARTRNIRIELIPPPDGTAVRADGAKLRLALEHLLLNAVRATPKEGIISVEGIDRSDHLEVYIEDHGHGMDTAQIGDLLEPFHRIPRTDDNGGELGIGLAIVRSITEGHGGRLSITSAPMEGTNVSVSIPR